MLQRLDTTAFESSLAKQFTSMQQYSLGFVPSDAGIGNGNPELEPGQVIWNLLTAGQEIALQHETANRLLAPAYLVDDRAQHPFLPLIVLAGVGVAAINDDGRHKAFLLQKQAGALHIILVVVGALVPSPKNKVAAIVAGRSENRTRPLPVHTDERRRLIGALYCIDSTHQVPAGAVLEPHCNAQAAGKIAMNLAFGGSRPDAGPAHQLIDVLGDDGIKHFTTDRQPDLCNFEEQGPGQCDPPPNIITSKHL